MARPRVTVLDRINDSMMKFRDGAERVAGECGDDPWLLNPFLFILAVVWDFLGIAWE